MCCSDVTCDFEVAVLKLWSRRLPPSCGNPFHLFGPLSEPRDCSQLAWSWV